MRIGRKNINAKFNIDDEVYYIEYNRAVKGKITGMYINIKKIDDEIINTISYMIEGDVNYEGNIMHNHTVERTTDYVYSSVKEMSIAVFGNIC